MCIYMPKCLIKRGGNVIIRWIERKKPPMRHAATVHSKLEELQARQGGKGDTRGRGGTLCACVCVWGGGSGVLWEGWWKAGKGKG